MNWVHVRDGLYKATSGPFDAYVVQDGEIWRSCVAVNGLVVDRGEWDSRSVALRNAASAVRRATDLRAPLAAMRRRQQEEMFEDEGDEGDDG